MRRFRDVRELRIGGFLEGAEADLCAALAPRLRQVVLDLGDRDVMFLGGDWDPDEEEEPHDPDKWVKKIVESVVGRGRRGAEVVIKGTATELGMAPAWARRPGVRWEVKPIRMWRAAGNGYTRTGDLCHRAYIQVELPG